MDQREPPASASRERIVAQQKFGKAETSQGNTGTLASKTTLPLGRTVWIYLAR